jgi:hypothetical protein
MCIQAGKPGLAVDYNAAFAYHGSMIGFLVYLAAALSTKGHAGVYT